MNKLLPSIESLAYRAQINSQLSLLRRTTPRVPFFRLAAHRIPTRWTLYRGLLESSPTPQIRWRIGALFRKFQHLTSPQTTKLQLQKGHAWLRAFQKAEGGDARWQRVLSRYSSFIEARAAKERFKETMTNELEWKARLSRRPILTGGFLRPSLFNKPLPRLKPQPNHITMMIRRRRDARQSRYDRWERTAEWRRLLVDEAGFEKSLERIAPLEREGKTFQTSEWLSPIDEHLRSMKESAVREENMARMKIPEELWQTVKQARREKIANKTREKDRERRGSIFNHTRAVMRQGLPAHLLAVRGEAGAELDRLIKDPSEGGYAGMVKKKAGMKLKRDTRTQEEAASPEAIKMAAEIRDETRARSQSSEN